jgi:altronate dehydratase small subunit
VDPVEEKKMAIDAIALHAKDNVATAVQDLKAGQEAIVRLDRELSSITIQENIPYGHKFTVRDVLSGQDIIKYGEVMGRATADIGAGCHAHVQNIESLRGRGDLRKGA